MGAIHFSIDKKLVEMLTGLIDFDIFIETGTYRGKSLEIAETYFPQLYSIELSEEYYKLATKNFDGKANVVIINGNSACKLAELVEKNIGKNFFYWLDAHWCADENTEGEASQCPLLGELKSIGVLNDNSIILIDDARMFMSTPGKPHEYSNWPDVNEVFSALSILSRRHQIIIIDDVIVFYPERIKNSLRRFCHEYGADWLTLAVKGREHDKLLSEVEEKDREIQSKEKALMDRITDLRIKEADLQKYAAISDERLVMIHKLEAARVELRQRSENEIRLLNDLLTEKERSLQYLNSISESRLRLLEDRTIRAFLNKLYSKFRRRLKSWLTPRLGSLNQHPPRTLRIPARYNTKKELKLYPKFSIVTPSFNQANFIERTINSVLSQQYPELEYIVQDGGSTDGVDEILRKYDGQLYRWESAPDEGQAHAIDLGFRKSSGQLMYYINSDDLLLPGALHYVADYFNKNADIDVVYGHRILIDENDFEIGRWVMPPHDDEVITWADYLPQETLFWRRDIWEKAGGRIDVSYKFAMDWDLILRFREAGARFKRLPRFIGAFRVHSQQKTSESIESTGRQEMARLRKRCHGREISDAEIYTRIGRYLKLSVLYNKLYRARILKY
jgi:glycosyltransferase involved in cell wall biosynthesis